MFFYKRKLCIVWIWFITKIILTSQKYLSCSSLEQKFIINFLVAKKWKPCEIYRRMCDVYGEAILVKNIYKIIMGLPLKTWVEEQNRTWSANILTLW